MAGFTTMFGPPGDSLVEKVPSTRIKIAPSMRTHLKPSWIARGVLSLQQVGGGAASEQDRGDSGFPDVRRRAGVRDLVARCS